MLNVNHLIIYLNGNLLLLQKTVDGQYATIDKIAAPANEDPYRLLKNMSHYAVRFYWLLDRITKEDIHLGHVEEKLRPLREELEATKQNYHNKVESELHVIDLTLVNIRKASNCSNIRQINDLYKGYSLKMDPHLQRYIRQAAELQLNGINKIISKWMVDYSINLKSTYFDIVGPRGPKEGLIELQYFRSLRSSERLADENTLSGGIIYSEMFSEQMGDLDVQMIVHNVARDLASQEVAEGMLGDRTAMSRDILSDEAKPILAALGLGGEKPKSIPERVSSFWSSFWRPEEESKSKNKCPFRM